MGTMTKCIALPLLGLLLALPQPSQASQSDEEKSLITYLSAHEFRPSRRILDKISKDTNRLLVRVSTYRHLRPTVRVRALAALALYPSERSRRYLLSLFHERSLKGSNTGLLLRSQAMRSAARAFGIDVVDDIKALRDDEEEHIRAAVAHALADSGQRSMLSYLRSWLSHAKTIVVKSAIDQSIERLKRLEETRP